MTTHEQTNAATELLLFGPNQRANAAEAHLFLQSLKARGIDPSTARIISRRGRPTYAVLPVLLPGRTLMLISGMPDGGRAQRDAEILVASVVEEYASLDITMMQILLDPHDAITPPIYAKVGFRRLTELIYLEGASRASAYEFPPGVTLESYSEALHGDFAAAIQGSYENTLDCPALNGVRSIEDIIASHRAAGEYNPANWLLLRDGGRAVGVLILARIPQSDVMELVYIGLVPIARGRGLAIRLLLLAMTRAHESGCPRLTTAVDADNKPAMNLYFRAGMQRIGSRIAMVRVMHATDESSSTIHPQNDK